MKTRDWKSISTHSTEFTFADYGKCYVFCFMHAFFVKKAVLSNSGAMAAMADMYGSFWTRHNGKY